jgi:acyl transferase domain-containing protein
MAGRFPGASNPREFWRNLCEGRESIARYSDAGLLKAGEDPALLRDPHYVRAGARLSGVELFDAGFFGFSAREAAILDPQHRQFLEVCWEALEDAGHVPERFPGSIGVFAGSGMHSYFAYNLAPNRKLMSEVGEFLIRHTGNDKDFLTTRASYCLNLTGPSVAVQTACSTSLVAIHLAAQSLLNGECDLALAGGVTIQIPHDLGYVFQEGEILAPDGHCRAFDQNGRGTVFGSGAGVVVLRRAEEAFRDNDGVYAIVRGSAMNNDGARKVAYFAPSVDGQARCVAEALAVADVSPRDVSYIEAHGTGTAMGDPVEIAALVEAFGGNFSGAPFCGIGSVKTNIGHLDTAAGVASFIKTVLALSHRQIPASLHFQSPNPACGFDRSPFYVNSSLAEWKSEGGPRRAGVNSLGVGGTNAHVVLEEAPAAPRRPDSDQFKLLCLSARSHSALDEAAARLLAFLRERPDISLDDVAHTLRVGRRAFKHRRALTCRNMDEAIAALASRDGRAVGHAAAETEPPVVFMFPGGGAQYPGMGLELFRTEPVFRRHLDEVLGIIEASAGLDLRTRLFPPPGTVDAAEALEGGSTSILSTFAIEYALAQLWMSFGVHPVAFTGHSLGEVTAACLAGVMSLADAVRLLAARGRLLDRLPAGATVVVALAEAGLTPYLPRDLSIAAVNAPAICVVSGPRESVEALEVQLNAADVDCRRLRLSFAAHTSLLDPHLKEFAAEIASIRMRSPDRPVMSNETGHWVTPDEVTRTDYWVKHLRRTVRFGDGLARILDEFPTGILLEVGPGTTLSSLVNASAGRIRARASAVSSLRHPTDTMTEAECFLRAVGRVWMAGFNVDWARAIRTEGCRRVSLPAYPFEHQRYWIDRPALTRDEGPQDRPAAPSIARTPSGDRVTDWFYRRSWMPSEPLQPDLDPDARWLIFADADGLGARVQATLEARGLQAVVVEIGDRFEKLGPSRYAVEPGSRPHYAQLVQDLRSRAPFPRRILHLWTSGADNSASTDAVLDRGFYSLLFLAQALASEGIEDDLRLAVVSSHMHVVGDDGPGCPEKATLLGPCRVIPREFPNIRSRSVDIRRADDATAEDLIAEVTEAGSPQPIVCYRNGQRWVQAVEPWPAAGLEASGHGLRSRGAYVVVGGYGGLGLAVAEHLARTVQARIALVGRTGLPDRADWGGALEREDGAADAIRRIREIERLGGEVLALEGDLCDEPQMRAAFEYAASRFGAIDGVFHAAGVLDDGLIAFKARESAERVLRPKVQGTLVLAAVARTYRPDFLVLFSSVSAELGLAGQADYTAANAFLSAFAESRARETRPRTIAVEWAAWRDVGMAARALSAAEGNAVNHPLLGRRRVEPQRVVYSARYRPDALWILDEHRVDGGSCVVPGTAYVEIVRAAVEPELGSAIDVQELLLLSPLVASDDGDRDVSVTVERGDTPEDRKVTISSRGDAGWVENARATARRLTVPPAAVDLHRIAARCRDREVVCGPGWRSQQERRLTFGRRWRCLERMRLGRREALIDLEIAPEFRAELSTFALHPALLDQATGSALLLVDDEAGDAFYVPMACQRVRAWRPLAPRLRVHARYLGAADGAVAFDVTVADEDGQVLVEMDQFTMRRIDATARFGQVASGTNPGRGPAGPDAALQSLMANGIAPARGLEALDVILATSLRSPVIVTPVPLRVVEDAVLAAGHAGGVRRDGGGERLRATPRTPIERQLVESWSRSLGLEDVGIDDNWFELGGHSLLAIRMLSQLRKAFHIDLPLNLFFESPTISAQARVIERAVEEGAPSDARPLGPVGREAFRQRRPDLLTR